MASIAQIVDRAVRTAGIPIDGVSIGDPANRSTWTVQFLPAATPAQQTQAQGILNTVAIDAAAQHVANQRDVQAYVDAMPLLDKAVNLTILDQVNVIRSKLAPPLVAITPQQWIDAVKAKVDGL